MPQRLDKKKKKKKKQHNQYAEDTEKRANSYLPYSNHNRDPNQPNDPIYLDDELPSFNQPGQPVGSMLHDNIAMEMMEQDDFHNYNTAPHKNINSTVQPLAPMKKKRWWTRIGISGRKLVFFGFVFIVIVIIVWFFVWPRTPTLQYVAAYLEDNPTMTNSSMQAVWQVNFTVLNQDNWIPTNIQNFAVSVIDTNTGTTFGSGNSNHLMLTGRSIDQMITIPIYIDYNSTGATDTTFQDLSSACSIVNQDLSSPHTQTLSVKFKFVYYIAGIVWHTVSTVAPTSTHFQCPTSV